MHYPTLDKPGAQSIAACKNQIKQGESSDHWKPIKTLFLNKITRITQKTKRLTGIQVLTKDFTSYEIRYVFQKKKVTQLVKPINYRR